MIKRTVINISVIIPAYNSAVTITETIRSVQLQTYNNWEIIVVDDGSIDETVSIVNDLAEKDNRIHIITQQNQQVSAARNNGIKNARYDWLLFLDSDDWIAPQYFEKVTSVLAADEDIDGVHCGWTRVTPDGKWVREMYSPSLSDLFPVLAKICPFAIHACVVRKSLVELGGGFDTSLITCEEWDLWQKITRIGARFEALKEVMAFYRMRPHSLSSDGMQFFNDAMRVLAQAYSPDDRLKHLDLRHPDGESFELLPGRKLALATWFAGLLMGDGRDTKLLLTNLAPAPDPSLEPYWVADNIFEAALIPSCKAPSDWYLLYQAIEINLKEFLTALEAKSGKTELAKRSILILEKMILENTQVEGPVGLSSYYAVSIEITHPVKDILVENRELTRLLCFLKIEGKELGKIELPICEGLVSEWVLKDAIAAKFSWQILGRFFENNVYNKTSDAAKSLVAIHNEIGWTTFLQQLWNRPGWKSSNFYEAKIVKEKAAKKLEAADVKIIEISEELPDIVTDTQEYNAVFSMGGVEAGVINIPVENKLVRASEIRSAININSGYELCRVCVREALIGKSFNTALTLSQRLREATANKSQNTFNIVTNDSLVLGRRAGPMGISASRRAILPAATSGFLIEMAKTVNEPIIQQPADVDKTDRVVYVPEIKTGKSKIRSGNKCESQGNKANLFGRQHFETLFSKQPDPWKYSHPYEQTKYEFTLSLLPKEKINKALEIACAEGHFTEQLAPLVKDLIAADISQIALERAAGVCKRFDHIQYKHLDLVKDDLPGQFDLITCSEVLYYLSSIDNLKAAAQKITKALLPDGYLVMAHANQVIDEPTKPGFDWGLPFGAKVIGETFAKVPSLELIREIRTPLYRVQLFQRKEPKLFSWFKTNKGSVQYFDQPTPVPDRVKDQVRWNGGKPSVSTALSAITTDKLPILMYHRVAPEGADNMSRYRVSPAVFEEQLQYLKDSGYYSPDLNDWMISITTLKPLPGLAVVFTFDDGYQDFFEYAWPLLRKYGFKAIVFLVSDYVGKQNAWDKAYGEELPLMGWQEILELEQQGVEFGSHTVTHKPLTSLSPTDIVLEGARSRTELQGSLQKAVKLFAYPYGDTDDIVSHLIGACGYTLGFSCESKLSSYNDDAMRLPRIEIEGSFSLKEFVSKLS
jgi:peptidoglycan/xylan/chitin deacetylase (PgdA/CDA1 family)/2-polyprenyl-3-methyl-5-hydroxy-6-metoxy-1,4-benzoquinol methylase